MKAPGIGVIKKQSTNPEGVIVSCCGFDIFCFRFLSPLRGWVSFRFVSRGLRPWLLTVAPSGLGFISVWFPGASAGDAPGYGEKRPSAKNLPSSSSQLTDR
jgi:hypothetical protein